MNGPGCHSRRFVYLLVTVVSIWSAAPAAVGVPVPENDGLVPAPGNGQPAEPAPIHPSIALTIGAASAEQQRSVPVAVQRGNLVGAQGQQSKTMLFLFRRGDKFIKIRATDVGELPLALLVDAIEVPPESRFMALLRAGARERSARTPTHEADVLYVE